jgi:hypothetical protein
MKAYKIIYGGLSESILGGKALSPIGSKDSRQFSWRIQMVTESEFAGKWKVIEAVDMLEDYLSQSPDPHILIIVNEKNEVTGSYQFGTQDGYIDGRFEKNEDIQKLIFSFEGWDEADLMNGSGTLAVESGDTYLLTMKYENGNTFSFRCQAAQDDLGANDNDEA